MCDASCDHSNTAVGLLDNDNDNDNDKLTEDVSNMRWTSGPAGMSDGVMTPRKNIGNLERC